MRLTPQPVVDLFDPASAAAQLRAVGVCLADVAAQPMGPCDTFFERFALPALRTVLRGGSVEERIPSPPGVSAARTEVTVRKDETQAVLLVAWSGQPPQDAPSEDQAALECTTGHLPAYSTAALQRLAARLGGVLGAQSQLAVAQQELETLTDQLSNTYEELSLVYELGSSISVTSPTQPFLTSACETTASVAEVRTAGVLVWDKRLGEHPPLAVGSIPLEEEELLCIDKVLRSQISQTQEQAGVLLNDVRHLPGLAQLYPKVRQLLAVPMRRHGRTLGCLFVIDKDVPPDIFGTFNRGVFTSIDRKLLTGVAVHLALFLENRKLFADAQSLMMGLLHGMVAAVDAKDAYTCGHSVRVALFAKRLAMAAGYDAAFCERVYLAGLLHDVGKIGVDDAVLRKPGKLTDDEFDQIKRHPEIGYRILEGIPQISDLMPGVLHHHEKYDGRGYPHRLAGENIPLLGRLLCIADSFDAMTSSRTYRAAMPLPVAMAEIQKCRGTQFDPGLAELFCSIPEPEILELIAAERDRKLPTYEQLLEKVA